MKHFNKNFLCHLKRNNQISTCLAQKYCQRRGTIKFKSKILKNSQKPTKKLVFYSILTLKIKRFDPLRKFQLLVNGDADKMTVKLMDIRNPFEKKEFRFFKRMPERGDVREDGEEEPLFFFFLLAKNTFWSLHFQAILILVHRFYFYHFQSLFLKTCSVLVPTIISVTELSYMAIKIIIKSFN